MTDMNRRPQYNNDDYLVEVEHLKKIFPRSNQFHRSAIIQKSGFRPRCG